MVLTISAGGVYVFILEQLISITLLLITFTVAPIS
ncbi:hypothetical protein SDC9_165548 [bioreactor metagenome]|uniref:Uncharacterized protein n=1 Tax=bioreactor metagenome TaxID=1076179 RepID=A0A645FX05_9ZZZZ